MAQERANTASATKTAAAVSSVAARRDETTGNASKGVVAINRCMQVRRFQEGDIASVTLTLSIHHAATQAEGKWSSRTVVITAVPKGNPYVVLEQGTAGHDFVLYMLSHALPAVYQYQRISKQIPRAQGPKILGREASERMRSLFSC